MYGGAPHARSPAAAVPHQRPSTRRTSLPLAGLSALALAGYLALFLRVLWRIGDEGSIIYGAQRVTQGEIPYRDFFEVIGPGAFYWLALWFTVLGTTWATSRLAILVTALGSVAAVQYITTRYYRGALAPLPALFYAVLTVPLWPAANHHFDSNLWVLLAMATFISRTPVTGSRALLAGLLAGIGSTFIPQKGVLFVLGLTVGSFLDAIAQKRTRELYRPLLLLLLGLGLTGSSVVLFFWSKGALGDLVYANAVWPATQYHTVNLLPYGYGLKQWLWTNWIEIFSSVTYGPIAWVFTGALLLPLVVVAVLPLAFLLNAGRSVVDVWRQPSRARSIPWTLWCAGLALAASEWHRPDIFHLVNGSPLLLIAVGLGFREHWPSAGRFAARTAGGSLALLAAWLAFTTTAARTPFETRRGRLTLQAPDDALQFIQANTARGEDVFVYPYYPMYYFLADIRNPTRYSNVMYHMNTADQLREVIDALESRRVRFVLWDTLVSGPGLTRFFPNYRDPPYEDQILERYLERHYEVLGIKGNVRVLRRIGTTAMSDSPPRVRRQ